MPGALWHSGRVSMKPLLAAAAGQTPTRRPVWFMRQAGRSLPEYRALRADRGMLESCFDPAMVCEITMQPVRRHDTDGAILFSDIVVPLKAAGIDLDIVAGTGPVIVNPVRSATDVAAVGRLVPEAVGAIGRAVSLLRAELDPTPTALIGFAGAPFTLASYLIEGGPSRHYANTKAMMYGDPPLWHDLMGRLVDITVTFLRVQLDAGAQAVQLFDSWAGMLSRRDYETFVAPHSSRVFAEISDFDVPRIHFGVGTGELLAPMARVGADVVGVNVSTAGARRLRISAASVSCSSGPFLASSLSITPSSTSIRSRMPSSASSRSASPPGAKIRSNVELLPPDTRSSNPPGPVKRSTTPPGRISLSAGPPRARARPIALSFSVSSATRLAPMIAPRIGKRSVIGSTAFPSSSPRDCFTAPSATVATASPASAAAMPALTGAFATPTMSSPMFTPKVYGSLSSAGRD